MTRHVNETSSQVAESDQHMRSVATLMSYAATIGIRSMSVCGARNLHRGLFEKPIEPIAGELRRLVEPFARVDIVVSNRQHNQFFGLTRPLIELLIAFDGADVVVLPTDQQQRTRRDPMNDINRFVLDGRFDGLPREIAFHRGEALERLRQKSERLRTAKGQF